MLAGASTYQEEALAVQEEQQLPVIHHQVGELSWLCQQLQQEFVGWKTAGLPLIHQCLMEQLAAAIAKRAEQLWQAVRRDLERKAQRDAKHDDGREHESSDALAAYDQAEGARTDQHYTQALEGYDQTISREPRFTLAYHGRAAVYRAYQQYERALADYGWILIC